MDGSKAVQYYDAKNRSIKVSRNVAFNEDEELRALDTIEVPGIQVEGEIISPATSNRLQHQEYLNLKPLSQDNFGKPDLLTTLN